MPQGLSATELKNLRAAIIQLQNNRADIEKLGRIRHVDVTEELAANTRASEIAEDLLREYGNPVAPAAKR